MIENTSRRDFLKLTAAGGAMIATTSLPATAATAEAAFAKRGRFERLALHYAIVNAGATKPFSVLHISDTHLSAAYKDESEKKQKLCAMRNQTFGGMQEIALADSLAWAKQNVDYVVHTGDLIDWQSRANYDLVRKYFGKDIIGSVGNHEYSPDMHLSDRKETYDDAFRAPSRAALSAAYPFDITFDSHIANGVNFITIDDVYGMVSEAQIERFKAEVAKGLPIVLCMHVPFFTDAIWLAHCKYWTYCNKHFSNATLQSPAGDYKRQLNDPITQKFLAYLKTEPLLKAILTGHLHITIQDRFSPTAMEYVVGGNFMFHGEEILFT